MRTNIVQEAPAARAELPISILNAEAKENDRECQGQPHRPGRGEEIADFFQHAAPTPLQPAEERIEDQAINEQDHHVPHVHSVESKVARTTNIKIHTLEIMRQELEVRAAELTVRYALEVNLQGSVGEHRHEQWDKQAQDFVFEERTRAALVHGIEDACA